MSEEEQTPARAQSDDLGRVYEIGFNTGIWTEITQKSIEHVNQSYYEQELGRFHFGDLVHRLADQYDLINRDARQLLSDWTTDFFRKGWLDGLSFFRAYLDASKWRKQYITIRYLQANFRGANSFGLYTDAYPQESYRILLSCFGELLGEQADQYGAFYAQKGHFLNADTLLFLQYTFPGKPVQYRILCVDESIFSLRSMADLGDIGRIEEIRRRFRKEVQDLRAKSVFARLEIDTGHETFDFSESLRRYFTAFRRSDKESAKMIQAGSYAYSFYQFLVNDIHVLPQENVPLLIHIAGWSNQGKSIMAIEPQNLSLLRIHHNIYTQQEKDLSLVDARGRVLQAIRRNTAKSFGKEGTVFVQRILDTAQTVLAMSNEKSGSIASCMYEEEIAPFLGTASTLDRGALDALELNNEPAPLSVQNTQAALIRRALKDESQQYLILTGSPGTGKTTEVVKHLVDECSKEGFFFFYASPRKQVNLDIVRKFQHSQGTEKGLLRLENLITLNSSSTLIEEYEHCPTVEYHWNGQQDEFCWHGVTFVDANVRDAQHPHPRRKKREHFRRLSDDTLRVRAGKGAGVLYSLCQATYAVLNQPLDQNPPHCVVATASIQALKKIEGQDTSRDTLEHFHEIFKHLYNRADGEVSEAGIRAFRQRVKHIVVMIDEITGDDSGVEFLWRIGDILKKYELMNPLYGFSTKIIVADASLIGTEVIEQHLKSREPSPDKIFFLRTKPADNPPISVRSFTFRTPHDATMINVNSYPAGELWFHYHLTFGSPQLLSEAQKSSSKQTALPQIKGLVSYQQKHMEEQIFSLLHTSSEPQMIIYIQNKRRLAFLIRTVNKRLQQEQNLPEDTIAFQEGRDYLIIHADISPEQQQHIQEHPAGIRIIFMTSSASRGLSFPRVRSILVDVPRFDLAKNLMEIVQVIYRGRGNAEIDRERKDITFYFAAPLYSKAGGLVDQGTPEGVLDVLNMLLLLKLSLLTRIQGYGQMGSDTVRIIPLGGKSVSVATDTFGDCLSELLSALANERKNTKSSDELLISVHTDLKKLLRSSETVVRSHIEARGTQALLSSPTFQALSTPSFYKRIEYGLTALQHLHLEPFFVDGELLITSLAQATVYESYPFRLAYEIKNYANKDLLQRMLKIKAYRRVYTERLRMAMREAIELIEKIDKEQTNKSQVVEQRSRGGDRYIALPHLVFTSQPALKAYFESYHHTIELTPEEELGEDSFKGLLDMMLRTLYPVNNILPVAANFESYPYAIFRSYSFQEARQKLFTDRYLLASTEFNVLTMLLSKE